jgi:hypothetical protein
MNVVIGTEASQFPEKEYICGIFLALYSFSMVYSEKVTQRNSVIFLKLISR